MRIPFVLALFSCTACASRCPSAEGAAAEPPAPPIASSARQATPAPPEAHDAPRTEPPASATEPPASASATVNEAPATSAAAASSAAPVAPPAPALPEVKISSYGLHVGGGPNDRATKDPLEHAVEARFAELAACYRLAEEPQKGGIFGVDLAIPRGGGHATARQPRTGMKGKALRECLVHELELVDFPAHKKGALVISYSLKFEIGG